MQFSAAVQTNIHQAAAGQETVAQAVQRDSRPGQHAQVGRLGHRRELDTMRTAEHGIAVARPDVGHGRFGPARQRCFRRRMLPYVLLSPLVVFIGALSFVPTADTTVEAFFRVIAA